MTEEIACIFCGTTDGEVAIEENGWAGRQCARCGLIYVSPRPTPAEVQDIYGHDQAQVRAATHLASSFQKGLVARHHLGVLRRHRPGRRLLELGAGSGVFLAEARRRGFEPHGIELNPAQVAHIRDELGIQCDDRALSPDSFGGEQFDVVYHADVVSHFHDPIGVFDATRQRLVRGGLLMIETGNFGDVDWRHYRAIDRFQYPDHLFLFTEANLRDLLDRSGFDLVELRRYPLLLHLWLQRRFKGLGGRSGSARQDGLAGTSRSDGDGHLLRRSLKRAIILTMYAARYPLARLLPARGRPQTLLLVARARDDGSS